MKKLIFILLLFSCQKPDETIFKQEPDIFCVSCFDQIHHIAWDEAFCGTWEEADRFIIEAEKTAKSKGILLHCEKY